MQHITTACMVLLMIGLLSANVTAQATLPSADAKLPTPKDPATACSREQQRKATKCKAAYDVFVHLDHYGPEEQVECCALLASYFGPNATADGGMGANCFCDENVWAEELVREEKSYLSFSSIFDSCSGVGHPIYYYQDGTGPCNPGGAAAAPVAAPAPAPAVNPRMKSFGEWMASLPSNNPILVAAIIVTIPSVIGFSTVIVWPFTFFSVLEVSRWVQVVKAKLRVRTRRPVIQ